MWLWIGLASVVVMAVCWIVIHGSQAYSKIMDDEERVMKLKVEIDGVTVPLDDCDWVLWAPCGCPWGVTKAGSDYCTKEDEVWRIHFSTARAVESAKKKGYSIELVTHEKWNAEIVGPFRNECPHKEVKNA